MLSGIVKYNFYQVCSNVVYSYGRRFLVYSGTKLVPDFLSLPKAWEFFKKKENKVQLLSFIKLVFHEKCFKKDATLPGEERRISVWCHTADLQGQKPKVIVGGWNVK